MNSQPIDNTIREQLRKIHALSESGIGGERENAKRMLESLCRKYKVTVEQILDPERRKFRFARPAKHEWALFLQCFAFIAQKHTIHYRKRGRSIWVELTNVEFLDLRSCFEHYRKLFNAELDALSLAFAGKYKLFGPDNPDSDQEPMDPAQLAKILAMMRGITGQAWKKPLATLTQ
jgi:hypothetical protein